MFKWYEARFLRQILEEVSNLIDETQKEYEKKNKDDGIKQLLAKLKKIEEDR